MPEEEAGTPRVCVEEEASGEGMEVAAAEDADAGAEAAGMRDVGRGIS